jgi:Ca2+-binding RTX toxin-like protein
VTAAPPAGFNEITGVTSSSDVVFAGAGDDIAYGDGGIDFLVGEAGRDELFGGAGDDNLYSFGGISPDDHQDTVSGEVLTGGNGDDSFFGSGGTEVLNSGAGRDGAWYLGDPADLVINLRTGTGSGGSAEGDTLISIEGAFGGYGNDTLIGNDRANNLYGDEGDDSLIGAAGDDTLGGANGADVLSGGAGRDWAFYGDGADKVVDLAAGTGVGGEAEGDTLISIENVIGGYGDDVLIGDEGGNELDGDIGSDRLVGGTGADTLDGGSQGIGVDVDAADYSTPRPA